ncbi:ankyrin repeat domain-containing protein 10 [Carassius gibelio]|uniref:ankyrin repeat domain-containing protein 10 n=1 Tax=Carassius gibelio TaxID=101364 RepID=UPI002279B0F8|nr:ankyrin repeat domain-containing protein 10 [Carassius gibelio]XP_052455200.1 ankyrin repeat domain-containing protein 10 [Carassius gibelio]
MSVGMEPGFSNDEVLNIRYPLHRACRDGDVGALCSLLQRSSNQAELAAEDSFYGWTPIHWAAHFGKLECVTRLVQVGCEVNALTTRFAQTPAHIAAFGGHPECLLWLLHTGAEINRQDYVGEAPIHKAARAGNIECINVLLIQGAKPDLRNANGLTAADLAHAQGFHDCAQLLSNMHNQLTQLNVFAHNGTNHSHIQGCSLLNGTANRKRFLDYTEPNHVKKAKTESMDFSAKTNNGIGEELEIMNVESAAEDQSDEAIATGLRNGHGQQNGFTVNSFATNGQCNSSQFNGVETIPAESRMDMCGSLHLNGSPSSCVSHRPAWDAFLPDSGEHLRYGHYHGFGDTAEDLEDANSCQEHSTVVKVEQHYDQEVLSAVQLFHGS